MCFRNLPIAVDAHGNARIKPGIDDPYSYRHGPLTMKDHRERIKELFERLATVCRVDVDRFTAADGTVVDLPALLELVDRGCAPELAIRIVAPLAAGPAPKARPLALNAPAA